MDRPLSVAVISPNRAAQHAIAAALESRVDTIFSLATYPNPSQLQELPQPAGGCVLFLDFSEPLRAKAIAEEADAYFPGISVVALHSGGTPKDLLDLMRLGVREVIGMPPMAHEVVEAVAQIVAKGAPPEQAGKLGGGRIVAFLPAKPGVGTTTLAIHSAAAAGRLSQQRTLLVDFDFRLGMTSFLLKLVSPSSVRDALGLSRRMDTSLWNGMVNQRGMLDVLGSAPIELRRSDPEEGTGLLLEFARHLYGSICVDLPGEMLEYELDTLRRAQECFLVCTPDVGSLHMAQRKAEMLRLLKVDRKTTVILNRTQGGFMPVKEIEEMLQLPVRFSVANAEKEMTAATEAASTLKGRSPLVTQIESIARHIAPAAPAAPEEAAPRKARGYFDFFGTPAASRTRP
jgi:pilus assembly protein CpaE